jgi:hypothetical protein
MGNVLELRTDKVEDKALLQNATLICGMRSGRPLNEDQRLSHRPNRSAFQFRSDLNPVPESAQLANGPLRSDPLILLTLYDANVSVSRIRFPFIITSEVSSQSPFAINRR